MAINERKQKLREGKVFGFCPFRQSSSRGCNARLLSSSSYRQKLHDSTDYHDRARDLGGQLAWEGHPRGRSSLVYSVVRWLVPARRRLWLDPPNNLYFPYEPGKQVLSAVRLKNSSKSHVAFKFQTTAPKSCYMRPPGGTLAPGESIIATVFKFVEHPEANKKHPDQKSMIKFKILSLKIKGGTEYAPELFDELKDQVAVERVLGVVLLDPERPSPAMDKLKRQLVEAEAALESRKKLPVEKGPYIVSDSLVINEWKERREKYLAHQQVKAAHTK